MRRFKKNFTRKAKVTSFLLALLLVLSMMTVLLGSRQDVWRANAAGNTYNPSKVAEYAWRHYKNYNLSDNDGYNDGAYKSFKNSGGDCANFVSQCLYYAGLPKTSAWNPYTDKWVGAVKLRKYLQSLGATMIEYPNASQVEVGDVIVNNWKKCSSGEMDYGHIMICAEIKNGVPIIAGHTTDMYGTIDFSKRCAVIKMKNLATNVQPVSAPNVTTSSNYYAQNAQVTVNWNSISGASYWIDVYKDGKSIISDPIGNVTTYTINTDSKGDYAVYVTAYNAISSAVSSCCQFYVGYLDKPIITSSERYYASGAQVTINWSACTGATKYHVSIWRADEPGMQGVPYGNGADVYGTSYTFNPSDGYYGFFVDAMNTNGGTQIAASDKYNFFVGNMRAPIIDSSIQYYAENGNVTIKWNACEGATDYFVHFWKDHEDYFGEYTNGATSYTFNNAPNGYYGVYVSAVNATGGYQWETSEKYNFTVGTLETPVINTAVNYYASDGDVTVNWNACEGATQYHISIWRADEPGMQGVPYGEGADVYGTSYTFNPSDGYYGFYVDAMNTNGGTQIANSEKYNFYVGKLEHPVATTAQKYYGKNAKVTINWNPCEGATSYHIIIWVPDECIISEAVSATSYTFDTEESKYGVFVYAVNKNGGYQDAVSEKLNFWSTDFSLDQTSQTLTVGSQSHLNAIVGAMDEDDAIIWQSSDPSVATVNSDGLVKGIKAGTATITAQLGNLSAACTLNVTASAPATYDVTPNVNGGASKLYEPWGLRYYAAFTGADTDKIADRGIAILKADYYTDGMTPAQFCASQNVHLFLGSRNELAFEEATSTYPNGRYFATLTKGIYSYDIGAKYYVVPFAVMRDGQTIYGAIKSNSMEKILTANLHLSTITPAEKAICTCILELKKSVAAHYEATGVPGASVDMNIPRGSAQSAATVKSTAESGITPNVTGGASRLIEPWGLRYFAAYTDSSNIAQRGMVILSEKYYQSSYSSSPDQMRRNANAYVFRDSDGTLQKQSDTNRYYGTVTEGISSKDIADVYYVVPFAVLSDGSYVYGTVKSNSMMKIMNANLKSSSVPATERAVSEDIIDLYNAVKAYYDAQ